MIKIERKLVLGVGIKDTVIPVYETKFINGKPVNIWICPYYRKWYSMLRRCYDLKHLKHNPNYIGCVICDEWKYFSNFIRWVDSQPNKDWQNCELDKDLVGNGKLYSPDTCIFIPKVVNNFINLDIECTNGYSFSLKTGRYQVKCRDPLKRNKEYLGSFTSEQEASRYYWQVKQKYCLDLAGTQEQPEVIKALELLAEEIFIKKLAQ